MEEQRLVDLLALRLAGVHPSELFELFSPESSLLGLDLPPLTDHYAERSRRYREEAQAELERCLQAGIEVLPFFSEDYPISLDALARARPLTLYLRGERSLLSRSPRLAIVGTRQPSPEGYTQAYQLAREVATREAVVISGLARGCDEAAHRGTLDVHGKTVAVVATGLDRMHPEGHEALQRRILDEGGLIVSEYPLGTPLEVYRLVQRNRLQAALADSLLVIECGEQSGTMHTVRFAERMHRPIYALPSQGLPSQQGNALLLRSGRAKPYLS